MMAALGQWTLSLDTYCDFTESELWLPDGVHPANLFGYTATMMIKRSPSDTTPLISLSTTPSAEGSLVIVDGPLSGTATVAANSTAVTLSVAQSLPEGAYLTFSTQPDVLYPVADLPTLSSTSATLQTPYTGSSSSSATASLVTGMVTININRSAMTNLVGVPQASWDLLLLSPNNFETKLLSGQVVTTQTVTH